MATLRVGDLGDYIREQRRSAQISLRQLANLAGVSNPYLSQIERGLRKPSAEILQQIARALRVSAEALYVRAGILEDVPVDRTVVQAVLGESKLSERQKSVLLQIYESFCTENAEGQRASQESEAVPVPDAVPEAEPVPDAVAVPDAVPVADAVPEAAPVPDAVAVPDAVPVPEKPRLARTTRRVASEPTSDGAAEAPAPTARRRASARKTPDGAGAANGKARAGTRARAATKVAAPKAAAAPAAASRRRSTKQSD